MHTGCYNAIQTMLKQGWAPSSVASRGGEQQTLSVMVLTDFVGAMAFELHVEGRVNVHQIER